MHEDRGNLYLDLCGGVPLLRVTQILLSKLNSIMNRPVSRETFIRSWLSAGFGKLFSTDDMKQLRYQISDLITLSRKVECYTHASQIDNIVEDIIDRGIIFLVLPLLAFILSTRNGLSPARYDRADTSLLKPGFESLGRDASCLVVKIIFLFISRYKFFDQIHCAHPDKSNDH